MILTIRIDLDKANRISVSDDEEWNQPRTRAILDQLAELLGGRLEYGIGSCDASIIYVNGDDIGVYTII